MILKKLIIKNLFGHFNHVIKFKDENITILTAPNGYGKTICLKIIDAIFNRKLYFLSELQFQQIELETSQGTLLLKKDDLNKPYGTIFLGHSGVKDLFKYSLNHENKKNKSITRNNIEMFIPFLERIGPREWVDERTGEVVNYHEAIEHYRDHFPEEIRGELLPDWFLKFSNSLNAHFIQDQRLILRKGMPYSSAMGRPIKKFVDAIEKYADELSGLIRESGFRSSHVSQELDSTFPVRLLKKDYNFKSLTVDQLKDELQKLQRKRTELSNFNLLSSERHFPSLYVLNEMKEEDTKVLTLYVNDTKEKLAAYDSIFIKIELFSRILNNKRLSFKKIKIDAKKGFHFETESGRPLRLTQLSSGEQHQVVLLYELIFKTQKNILVLIDEPEISLHVAWQKEFLKDLKDIIEIQNMPVVIATHSPQIIDNNWDLTVDLEGDC